MKVSVCISTWSRKSKLQRIIWLLEHQTFARKDYEIVVVDSNSSDGTETMMAKFCERYNNISYIKNVDNILASKRNVAAKCSTGDTIVFIDDDVFPTHSFIEAHYIANINNKDSFFCGQIRFSPKLCRRKNYYRFRDEQHLSKEKPDKELSFNKIVAMNLSSRRELFEAVGGFDERFIGYGCEDIEFGYRLVQKGYKLKYLEFALAYHREESSNIQSYGKKLYKTGLYGDRTLKRVCPKAQAQLYKTNLVLEFVLTRKKVNKSLEFLLRKTDSVPILYSYSLFKAYLYSCFYLGVKDQSKYRELSCKDIDKGW